MIKIDGVKHEDLVQHLCDTYGKLKFDNNNKEIRGLFNNLKVEILHRMEYAPLTERMELTELLVDESVLNEKKFFDDVSSILLESLNISDLPSNKEAVLIIMMDGSGSMGSWERYITKAISTWNQDILGFKYQNKLEKHFVLHSTEAEVVSEDEFYNKGESGGTIASSAYTKCLELINSTDFINKDIYAIHISDGDNMASDNNRTGNYLYDILHKVIQFQYVEVNQYNRTSTLMTAFRHVKNDKFLMSIIKDRKDVHQAIKDAYKEESTVKGEKK